MTQVGKDSLGTRSNLSVGGQDYAYYSLAKAAETIGDVSRLPFSMKVLLENLLRFEDAGFTVSVGHIQALADWRVSPEFDTREKAALSLAEAVTRGRVSNEVYQEARRHFDEHDYVELAVTAGFYAMVARTLDALGIQLEPEFSDYAPKLP